MKKVVFALLTACLVAALALVTVSAAPLKEPSLAPTRTYQGETLKQDMSAYLQMEQSWLTLQTGHIQSCNQVAATTQQLIDALKAEGKDPASLETALAAYNADIAKAVPEHATAETVLTTHTGFDASGNVLDLQAAFKTLVDGQNALRSAHADIVEAVTTLRGVLIQWQQSK